MLPFAVLSGSGVLVDSLVEFHFPGIESGQRFLFWLCLAVFTACTIHSKAKARKRLPFYHCVLICFPVFATYHSLKCHQVELAPLKVFLSEKSEASEFEGQIVGSVKLSLQISRQHDTLDRSLTRFDLRVKKIRLGQTFIPIDGKLRVVVFDEIKTLQAGSVIRIAGKAKSYPTPTNPGEFDRKRVLERCGYSGQVQCEDQSSITILDHNQKLHFWIWNRLQFISLSGVQTYFQFLKPENAEFAAALALGRRDLIPDDTREKLIVTGTAHLLSVSGLHLGLVMVHLHLLLGLFRVPLRAKFLTMLFGSLLYCSLTGLNAPVNRATIMLMNWVIANWIYRANDAINSLAVGAMLFLTWDCFLLFDIGVQLSFLAVGVIVSLNSNPSILQKGSVSAVGSSIGKSRMIRVAQELNWVQRWIVKPLSASLFLSVTLFLIMTPFLWLHFRIISPISIITNVLLGPLVIAALLLSLMLPIASMTHVLIVKMVSIPCDVCIDLIRWIIEIASTTKYGHLWLPEPSNIAVAIFYLVLFSSVFGVTSSLKIYLQRFTIAFWYITHLLLYLAPNHRSQSMDFVFLDVGHGTCVIIQDGNEKTWLYDCGSLGRSRSASQLACNALWELGISKIDGIFISHADSDHYNGIESLLGRFKVKKIYTTHTTRTLPTANLARLFRTAQSLNVVITTVHSESECLQIGQGADVLHPGPNAHYKSDNESSLVLEISFRGHSVVLPGDIDAEGIHDLTRRRLKTQRGLVMAPHHGRFSAQTKSFIDWSLPSLCVLSGSGDFSKLQISNLLKGRQITALSTHVHHALRIRLHPNSKKTIEHWHENGWQKLAVTNE